MQISGHNSYICEQGTKGQTQARALVTLSRFDNTNYDGYYHQEDNGGNAHPFSRVLPEFISILNIDCIVSDAIRLQRN